MPARQKPAKKSSKRRMTYTVEETAELLGLGLNQTYSAVHSGAIPSIRVGVRWLIPQAALEKKLSGEPSTR
jgi:excisionase family DNA binding protein